MSILQLRAKKRQQKIILWTIALFLGFGLVASSVAWTIGNNTGTTSTQTNQGIDPAIALEAEVLANPADVNKMYQLAITLFDKGTPEGYLKSAYYLGKILELNSTNVPVMVDRAIALFYIGQVDDAIKQVQEALKIDPNHPKAHFNYGIFLGYGKQNYKEGIAELQKAIALSDPTSPDVQNAKQIISDFEKSLNSGSGKK
ncbi:tetratricopeptide repeat protein [Carboxydothermus pertinax]|uniref:Uncharacterized protein n=1 Tax=Carboxydothermus pertinax TaxID=870242 RepID=A0A1L8CT87_9THEO|nr:tetratricopeptide repeat protein [Carboxydothermus pertinax]GAV22136.1 hypothetical protein cpu_06460 [Carboxydothermus pertinax]